MDKLNPGKILLKLNTKEMIIIGLLWIFSARAGLDTQINLYSTYDNNIFRTPEQTTDLISGIGMKLNYKPAGSNFNLFYQGDYSSFKESNLLNFYFHTLGADYSKAFGQDDVHRLYAGSTWTIRLNKQDHEYYDYQQFYAYLNSRFDLDFLFFSAGYNFRYRRFEYLSDLTNYLHNVFLQLNKSFETRTSLILEASFGRKSFKGSDTFTQIIESVGMSGKGQGKRWNTAADGGSTVVSTELPAPVLNQAVFLIRAAQSLHTRVGIYLQYSRQISLNEETNFRNSDDYFQDEELFDDPFSYESSAGAGQLTWLLPWNTKLLLRGGLISKEYTDEQAFTAETDTIGLGGNRDDEQRNFYIGFSKKFNGSKSWLRKLEIQIDFAYIDNKSNSYWYDYKNTVFGTSLKWQF